MGWRGPERRFISLPLVSINLVHIIAANYFMMPLILSTYLRKLYHCNDFYFIRIDFALLRQTQYSFLSNKKCANNIQVHYCHPRIFFLVRYCVKLISCQCIWGRAGKQKYESAAYQRWKCIDSWLRRRKIKWFRNKFDICLAVHHWCK